MVRKSYRRGVSGENAPEVGSEARRRTSSFSACLPIGKKCHENVGAFGHRGQDVVELQVQVGDDLDSHFARPMPSARQLQAVNRPPELSRHVQRASIPGDTVGDVDFSCAALPLGTNHASDYTGLMN